MSTRNQDRWSLLLREWMGSFLKSRSKVSSSWRCYFSIHNRRETWLMENASRIDLKMHILTLRTNQRPLASTQAQSGSEYRQQFREYDQAPTSSFVIADRFFRTFPRFSLLSFPYAPYSASRSSSSPINALPLTTIWESATLTFVLSTQTQISSKSTQPSRLENLWLWLEWWVL